ncbi:fructuronate reductase [Saccharopolyspora erythraea NRRL 2338]|uniref:Mannitol-1-phosphate 5-dehydrogenase n=2 Tax=Saccharopolyspora erythraea TaxID=1836 RepID=A4FJI1_SACEN|nr:mannitol dehydrogenase family protein [Saccharopolyspora erythraea]PFG97866.1 fructuronate reductase [Saccharopolyspora erythraea NRRL 2338]QRK88002.1 mannitol dehydrogenase family protein [Saccharopolyspora erythraea]CAM04206.1 fructuronate reductase [Saccharopolyspora erythraea NRRL 2338]
MTQPLGRKSLLAGSRLGASAPDRTGIVHLGLGNFHRAHGAVYTAQAMAAAGGDWGIRGFAHSSDRVVAPMRAQDNVYSILQLTERGAEAGLVDVHRDTGVAAQDPAAVVDAIADPAHRIVSLTVSEVGYTRDPATGRLALDAPEVAADLTAGSTPRTAVGMIARGLEQRAASGEPFAVLSCDNLQSAGDVTRAVVEEFLQAAGVSDDVLSFVSSSVSFPNGMVDRIVPRTTDEHSRIVADLLGVQDLCPVPAEEFTMWVLEDDFAGGRPAWDLAGATFSNEIEAYEMVKLRLLNGSHSLIAYLGILSGAPTIDVAWGQDFVREAVLNGITDDYLPTFTPPTGFDADAYVSELDARWRNPLIGHATTQVGTDGSLKLLQRIPNAALFHLRRGDMPHHLALCIAAWIACVAPPAGFTPEPLAERIVEPARDRLAAAVDGAVTVADHVRRIMNGGFFPDALAEQDAFTVRVADLLTLVVRDGVRAAAADVAASR